MNVWYPDIEVQEGVFGPSQGAQIILECMVKIPSLFQGKRVLDIGCGTGILGIFAAELGASCVCATDIVEEAIQNTLTNALANGVTIDAKTGSYGEPFSGEKFDVVIANLPQEKLTGFVNMRGNESILEFLPQAHKYVDNSGILILGINGCTPYKETFQEIQKEWVIVASKGMWVTIKDWVKESLSLFIDPKEAVLRGNVGTMDISSKIETPIFYVILKKK